MTSLININSQFDGGNIRCIEVQEFDDIKLEINKDHQSDFYQWFYFRASGVLGQECQFKIINAGSSAYTDGWDGYEAVASYDRNYWFRVPTEYVDGVLTIKHQPQRHSVYYAYFAPYTMERHADFIANLLDHPLVNLNVLGQTLDGQDIDQLIIGEPSDHKKKIWIHGRQHPGETQASWWAEGFLYRLLDDSDATANSLLQKAVFYVTPNMNPDGSKRGHLRTNAVGANLNREWLEPSMERSPEVYLTLQEMNKIGVDFCLDVHGDEGLPYNFIAGAEGVKSWNEQLASQQSVFCERLKLVNPDFQTEIGYPIDEPNSADMSICTNYMTEQFGCLSMTLEMPFKDTVKTPHEEQGWSPERCMNLGASCLDAIDAVIDEL